jgi:hypothetical protein
MPCHVGKTAMRYKRGRWLSAGSWHGADLKQERIIKIGEAEAEGGISRFLSPKTNKPAFMRVNFGDGNSAVGLADNPSPPISGYIHAWIEATEYHYRSTHEAWRIGIMPRHVH